ncbi:hypothetical protein EXIGLDRAFT_708708 [Exidia glandulosa HHB12029]|uniref:Uncharacterized protein n=1 Tax=Exidia glandulosa HHB12029 TaxID=1314781 RepID=A0A166N3R2_EXIGL|nr:hypothetical protein EXIGLDRAFT_708708 [Exidia glandulosa HHB12029]
MSSSTGETTRSDHAEATGPDIQIQIDPPEISSSGVVESPVGEDEGCPEETRERDEYGESVIVLRRRKTKDQAKAQTTKQIVEEVAVLGDELGVDIAAEVGLTKP